MNKDCIGKKVSTKDIIDFRRQFYLVDEVSAKAMHPSSKPKIISFQEIKKEGYKIGVMK